MKRFAATLWDLLRGDLLRGDLLREDLQTAAPSNGSVQRGNRKTLQRAKAARPASQHRVRPMQQRYDELVAEMKLKYSIKIRRWRLSSSGCAWIVTYSDGSQQRYIESPYPRGPMSCAIFLHEVGHHAIGLATYKPRCLEEYHAWRWSLATMEAMGFNVTDAVRRRMDESMRYAVSKACRRGLKQLPAELMPYLHRQSLSSR